jgi:hypothetical protein
MLLYVDFFSCIHKYLETHTQKPKDYTVSPVPIHPKKTIERTPHRTTHFPVPRLPAIHLQSAHNFTLVLSRWPWLCFFSRPTMTPCPVPTLFLNSTLSYRARRSVGLHLAPPPATLRTRQPTECSSMAWGKNPTCHELTGINPPRSHRRSF